VCPHRHRHFLVTRGEEKGSIESRGNISDVNNTLKPEELHWVEAILPTLISGVVVVKTLVNVVLGALSVDGRRR